MVDREGFEPPALAASTQSSTRLSYLSIKLFTFIHCCNGLFHCNPRRIKWNFFRPLNSCNSSWTHFNFIFAQNCHANFLVNRNVNYQIVFHFYSYKLVERTGVKPCISGVSSPHSIVELPLHISFPKIIHIKLSQISCKKFKLFR